MGTERRAARNTAAGRSIGGDAAARSEEGTAKALAEIRDRGQREKEGKTRNMRDLRTLFGPRQMVFSAFRMACGVWVGDGLGFRNRCQPGSEPVCPWHNQTITETALSHAIRKQVSYAPMLIYCAAETDRASARMTFTSRRVRSCGDLPLSAFAHRFPRSPSRQKLFNEAKPPTSSLTGVAETELSGGTTWCCSRPRVR